MCGFVGGTDPSWNYAAALASIEHRGPDDGRLHLDGPVRVGTPDGHQVTILDN